MFDIPRQLVASVVFDQSVFVKEALNTVLHEGILGLVLTSVMILMFLGSMRATFAVLLSIPISALATFVILYMLGSTVNTMILGGLALAFSRVIDNSVISLENIYDALKDMKHEVTVPEDIRIRAKAAIDAMLALPKQKTPPGFKVGLHADAIEVM